MPEGARLAETASASGSNGDATPERVSDASTERLSEPEPECNQRDARKAATTHLETLGQQELGSQENLHQQYCAGPIEDDSTERETLSEPEQKAARTITIWWRSSRQQDSELAKILAVRRAATTHENFPNNQGGVDRPDSRKVSFADDIGEPLEERASSGSADGPGREKPPAIGENMKVARFDFGIGLVRGCVCCSSKMPRLNRGCRTCQKRVCRKCFFNHACSVLASVHDLPNEDARSTPSVTI